MDKWASDPNKLAMLWVGQNGEEKHITFAQFAERSSRAANAFAELSIKKGDRMMVMLHRIPEWWESVLGLMKLGVIPIPCTTLLTPKDIQFRAEVAEVQDSLMFRCSTCSANSCNPAASNQTPYDLLFLRLASLINIIALSLSGIASRSCIVAFLGRSFKVLILRCTPSVRARWYIIFQ